MPRLVYDVES
jgi:hypothetical protein